MFNVQPDHIESVIYNYSMNSAMFISRKLKLPT